jgi:hypothetical protein
MDVRSGSSSRRLEDDPREQALLDEIEAIQAENADILKRCASGRSPGHAVLRRIPIPLAGSSR